MDLKRKLTKAYVGWKSDCEYVEAPPLVLQRASAREIQFLQGKYGHKKGTSYWILNLICFSILAGALPVLIVCSDSMTDSPLIDGIGLFIFICTSIWVLALIKMFWGFKQFVDSGEVAYESDDHKT